MGAIVDYKIVLIVVVGIVILGALALWLGRSLRITKDDSGFSIETDKAGGNDPNARVSVAKGADIESEKIGKIRGIESDGSDDSASNDVDVLENAKVKAKEIGDITGKEIKKQD